MPNKDTAAPQRIEDLRERHRALEEKKITARANLRTSQDTLNRLKQQARDSYGTDDIEELRKKLEAMKRENENKRADYQRHLGDVERQLAEVEVQHAEAANQEPQS
jgi:hypothetical protein